MDKDLKQLLNTSKREVFNKYYYIPSNSKRRIFGKSLELMSNRYIGFNRLSYLVIKHFRTFKFDKADDRARREVKSIQKLPRRDIMAFLSDIYPIIKGIANIKKRNN